MFRFYFPAISRLSLGYLLAISPLSQLYLSAISRLSQLYLSATSRLSGLSPLPGTLIATTVQVVESGGGGHPAAVCMGREGDSPPIETKRENA